ncbi:Icc-related predicted phosphoesterase [Ereboglobus sp. PH5-10]|uniref:metallophosphoesterase family protein n=1 Tax=Ereboglobus sp. PH5-10 TaxID=2940629 RepID=UPI002406088B|nr:metallophosphoesterase [Ereboglobus sp. PH5-10]MDF9827919.1 Icc-related predicted phosphoesterase [Ereboglobus sp. PH5-10]
MRILHVADLHFRKEWYEWVASQSDDYDVLVIAGDLLNMLPVEATPLPQQARVVRDWLQALPKPVVVCTGNHDVWRGDPLVPTDAWAEGGWLQLCKSEKLVVDGQVADFHGERFAAVKWGESDWPDEASLVVAHAPSAESRVGTDANDVDLGDLAIAQRIVDKRPKYILSGHVHRARDWVAFDGNTYSFNPGCDWLALTPNHIFIDTENRIARWHSATRGCGERALDERGL